MIYLVRGANATAAKLNLYHKHEKLYNADRFPDKTIGTMVACDPFQVPLALFIIIMHDIRFQLCSGHRIFSIIRSRRLC